MKKLALVLIIVLTAAPAQACRKFSVWHYPYRQRCYTALAPLPQRTKPASRIPETFHERINPIPVPELEWLPCPIGDERLRGIAILREMQDGP